MRRLAVSQHLAAAAKLVAKAKKALDGEEGGKLGEKALHSMGSIFGFVFMIKCLRFFFSKRGLICYSRGTSRRKLSNA